MKEIKKVSLSNVISKLTRNEMRYVMAGSGSGSPDCILTGNEKIIYSGGEPVSYVCEWKCKSSGTHWGGCSVWG